MGIKIKMRDDRDIAGRTIDFYPACDYCGEEITPETPANCENFEEDGAELFFVHKECSRAFRKGKPKMLWSEFVKVTIEAK